MLSANHARTFAQLRWPRACYGLPGDGL